MRYLGAWQKAARRVAWLAAMAVLAGFSPACTEPRPEVKDLEMRARQYMEARQSRNWSDVYDDFMDPAGRATVDKAEFLATRGGGFDILGFEVLQAEVDATAEPPVGELRMRMEALIPLLAPGGGSHTVRRMMEDPQQWVFRDGQWYVQLRR